MKCHQKWPYQAGRHRGVPWQLRCFKMIYSCINLALPSQHTSIKGKSLKWHKLLSMDQWLMELN